MASSSSLVIVSTSGIEQSISPRIKTDELEIRRLKISNSRIPCYLNTLSKPPVCLSESHIPYTSPCTTQHIQAQQQDPPGDHSGVFFTSSYAHSYVVHHLTDGGKRMAPLEHPGCSLSLLGQHLSLTIPGNISGNLLIGTVDKDDGVSAGDIAAGDS